MKKQMRFLAVLILVLSFCVPLFAMAHKPTLAEQAKIDRVNLCLQNAGAAARISGADAGSIGQAVDQVKLKQGYCACYTLENDTSLMQRYC